MLLKRSSSQRYGPQACEDTYGVIGVANGILRESFRQCIDGPQVGQPRRRRVLGDTVQYRYLFNVIQMSQGR